MSGVNRITNKTSRFIIIIEIEANKQQKS